MYNPTEGGTRAKHHLDGVVVTSEESGSVEGANGEIPSSANVGKPKNEDTALTTMDEMFGEGWKGKFGDGFCQGLLGKPTEANDSSDIFGGYGSVTDFLSSQEGTSFLAVLAKVLMMLARSSGQRAAEEREIKMHELMKSLEENLGAAKDLADGAKSALVAGIIGGVVGLVGAGIGMGANAYAARVKGRSADLGKQMKDLEETDFTDLVRADLPGDGTSTPPSAADMLRARKDDMATQIQDLEAKAAKVTSIGEGVSRVSGSAGGMSSSASTMVLTQAQAEQSRKQAVASQQGQAFGIEDEWQRSMIGLRDTVLGVITEAVRAMAQAQSSAFK
ncbi:type III secretion system translocon subunit SctB [Candidatus Ichthyocystis hellenicum]|uniref:type III secretion system translocon subunit SctB n=1 Tax=Candidatus Ichthyocystis hellenicum TaxID=1561003 RepID=UPI000B1AC24D|nr:type III secretion system translocon subunit SctB [Candidatus Ichthyocystis hellenicum]